MQQDFYDLFIGVIFNCSSDCGPHLNSEGVLALCVGPGCRMNHEAGVELCVKCLGTICSE